MTPWDLAKDSESSHQIALFCYTSKVEKIGFELAKLKESYKYGFNPDLKLLKPVLEIAFCYHCPNGGSRGDNAKSRAIAGGLLKAEGVKAGVLDIFWPIKREKHPNEQQEWFAHRKGSPIWSGLYIEMKKPSLKNAKNEYAGCSDAQLEFGKFVTDQGYCAKVCYSWLEAAEILEWYYNL